MTKKKEMREISARIIERSINHHEMIRKENLSKEAHCIDIEEGSDLEDLYMMTTFETHAPKFLDAEFEKHRILGSNSSSDRAIPLSRNSSDFYLPQDVRLNQGGMQGDELMSDDEVAAFHDDLIELHGYTKQVLENWNKVHKQHLNRYLMGFSWQSKVASGTCWENFFNRRVHKDADPAMYNLAKKMKDAWDTFPIEETRILAAGEWHTPYIFEHEREQLLRSFDKEVAYDIMLKISAARSARVSFYNHDKTDTNFFKDISLTETLETKFHPTPFEHQATPMQYDTLEELVDAYYKMETKFVPSYDIIGLKSIPRYWKKGITHIDMKNRLWSGQLRGWIMYRKLLTYSMEE